MKGLSMFDMDNTDPNEMDFKPYDPLKSLFDDFMYREKSIIKDYWTDDKFKVIFRPNTDRNQMDDNSTIFYYSEENINVGSLLKIESEYYLTLNKQAIENRIYKQSDLVKCNTIFNGFSDGYEIVIPAHVLGLTSTYGNSGNTISVASGNIELITQQCELTDTIEEGCYFYAIGGRYSVTKKVFDENGIVHIYAKTEVFTKPPTYTLSLSLQEAYKVGTTEPLTVIAKRTESSTAETVKNATIFWESSNSSIVSFPHKQPNGEASFNNVGEAEIVAIWKEHNIAETGIINVSSGVAKKCEITYSGVAEVKSGGSAKSFTTWFYDDRNELDDSIIPVWSLEYLAAGQSGNVTISETSGKVAKVLANSKAPTYTTLNLVLTDTQGEYNTKLEIEIVDLW